MSYDSNSVPNAENGIGTRIAEVADGIGNRKNAAEAAGVSLSTLNRWIMGESVPVFAGVARLAQAGGVSLDWIATGLGERTAMRNQPHEAGGYRQEADDFVYIEEMATVDEGIVSTRHAVRRDWLKDLDLDPARLCFLKTREDAMAPTIQPGDLLLCETYQHRTEGQIKTGLIPGELPPQDGIYIVRFILDNTTNSAIRRLRLDMAGGLISIMETEDHHIHLAEAKQLKRIQIVARVVASWRTL